LNEVSEKIANEIRELGAISFARFVHLALYCPDFGYYEREKDTIGRRGDYYTSVSTGELFGEMLAFQFAEWLTTVQCLKSKVQSPEDETVGTRGMKSRSIGTASPCLEGSGTVQIVEAVAHDGRLANDILTWLREHRPELFRRLEYWIIEPSEHRRLWQRHQLIDFGNIVQWATTFTDLAPPLPLAAPKRSGGGSPLIHGIIFCNELLDAFPARRLGWDAQSRSWFEWGVKMRGERFVWTRMAGDQSPKSGAEIPRMTYETPAEAVRRCLALIESDSWLDSTPRPGNAAAPSLSALESVLPDGFTVEISPAAEAWWREAASILDCGKLLTIDYGLTAEQFFSPERKDGTLRAYRGHRQVSNVLADPGHQDITAQVNFSALRAAGESAGLKTESLQTQTQFLTQIAARLWNAEAPYGPLTPDRARQFHTLTHPDHLGRAFRVLVQSQRV
jgi:SAM-dependent MidA family methyltransferase